MTDTDILIIGSGMGGASLAAGLAPSGLRILILERGEYLVDQPAARDPAAIFGRGHFRPTETWLTPRAIASTPETTPMSGVIRNSTAP